MSLEGHHIAFIGGGHITAIIIERLTSSSTVSPEHLIVSDPDHGRREFVSRTFSVETTPDNADAVRRGDIVFVNVPPQAVSDVVDELSRSRFPPEKVIVTLAAGIQMETYRKLGDGLPVVRALPNPPSQIGRGIAAVAFNEHVSEHQRGNILTLLASLGEVVVLEEHHINVAMALSSPVAPFLFFQSMIDAGVRLGVDRAASTEIVYQTIVGAMEVWNQRRVPLLELMHEATTPGGVSAESIFTLDKYSFRAAVSEAVASAKARADELGK